MSEIKITELKKAAKELNEEFGFEIDVKLKKEELCEVIAEIWDATKLDKKDENYIGIDEIEDLSETTQAVLNALKPESEEEEKESDDEQEEEEEDEEEVEKKPKKKKSAKELAKEAKELTKQKEAERKARVAEKKAEKAKEKKEKSISAMTFIQTEVCKNFKISNEDIIKKLEKAGYTTTSHRYVDMRRKEALAVISILNSLILGK